MAIDVSTLPPASLDRMVRAVEKVRERLLRASSALEKAGVPYVVIGGNAVAAWVSRVDESAVRNTRDVDMIIREVDLPAAKLALQAVGFVHRHSSGIDLFLDGPGTKARDALHVIRAGQVVRSDDPVAAPDVEEFVYSENSEFRHLTLEALVRMKLVANRPKDQTHIQDMLSVGLIDAAWTEKYPSPLKERFEYILSLPRDDIE
jgi:hypothetical protein